MNLNSFPVLVMAGITLYVGVSYLLFWLRGREEIGYLYFSGLCAAVAAYDVFSALLYNSQSFESSIWFQRGQFSAIAGIALWMILFAARALREKLSLYPRVLFGLYAVFVFASWIDSPLFLHLSRRAPKTVSLGSTTLSYLEVQPGPLLLAFYLLIFAGILTFYIYFLSSYRRRHEHGAALIQAGLTVFFLANINDILVGAGVIRFIYILEYSFLAVILVMDFLMQRTHLALIQQEKQHARELEASLAKIKTLRGLLPICTACKKIRDDKGYWQQVEDFVVQHSVADFSHSICPECARTLYPELDKKYKSQPGEIKKQDPEEK